jgi:hypothetical protein
MPSESEFEFPQLVRDLLRQAVHHSPRGQCVVLVPYDARMLTAQEAARLLSIPRPRLINSLASGGIPLELGRKRRRMRLHDLLLCWVRRARARRREAALRSESGCDHK